LRDVAEPRPAPNQALVAVHAFSLNRGELRSFRNNPAGWIPGQDVSGVVLQPAADGSGPPAGARIVALMDEGGWAERIAVPSHRMAVLPDNVGFEAASVLPVAGLTALRTLRHGAPLLGRRVLVTGAAGGVGHLAVQLAARSGSFVTAVVGSAARGDGLRALGAAEIAVGIDAAQGRFALILESAGGASLAAALRLVEPAGVVVVFGNSSGEASAISFADFRAAQNARLQSFFFFTSGSEDQFAPDLALLVSLIAHDAVRPRIGSAGSWRDIASVATALAERRIAGKAVLQVTS
jgi:NADPH:quinone reductase-like Zn-dependent oxidoreductase